MTIIAMVQDINANKQCYFAPTKHCRNFQKGQFKIAMLLSMLHLSQFIVICFVNVVCVSAHYFIWDNHNVKKWN